MITTIISVQFILTRWYKIRSTKYVYRSRFIHNKIYMKLRGGGKSGHVLATLIVTTSFVKIVRRFRSSLRTTIGVFIYLFIE